MPSSAPPSRRTIRPWSWPRACNRTSYEALRPTLISGGPLPSAANRGAPRRAITIQRDGDATNIKIEGAGQTRSITITKSDDGEIRIDRDGKQRALRERGFVWSPDRRKIIIDGVPLEELAARFREIPRPAAQTWFVCPKDKTMLRVPEEKGDGTFKCPIDGTTMEKRKARGFSFHFDHDFFESEEL